LPPGRYRFEVIASGRNGVWSPTPAGFAFSIAPRFWQVWPFYLLCGAAAIGLAAVALAYRLRWQRRLLEVEGQRALASERARIARDLHDDLGTALTGHALQLDVIRREAQALPRVSERLAQAATGMRDLAERLREVIWSANPRCDTVSSLASFLEQQAGQFLGTAGLRVRIDFPENIPALALNGMARHQLALGVREALSNIVRHAGATEAVLSLAIEDGWLIVGVADNGHGFKGGSAVEIGHGLANLRERFEQMGGTFECISAPGAGAKIRFRLAVARRAGPGGDGHGH
jgi:signal transduction histidine kinase